jgi:hypothetical protein
LTRAASAELIIWFCNITQSSSGINPQKKLIKKHYANTPPLLLCVDGEILKWHYAHAKKALVGKWHMISQTGGDFSKYLCFHYYSKY